MLTKILEVQGASSCVSLPRTTPPASLQVSELPVRKQPSQPEAVDIDQLTDSMLIDLLKRETAARDAYSKQIENNNQLIAKLMQHNDELLKQLRELRTDQEMQNQSRRLRDNQ